MHGINFTLFFVFIASKHKPKGLYALTAHNATKLLVMGIELPDFEARNLGSCGANFAP